MKLKSLTSLLIGSLGVLSAAALPLAALAANGPQISIVNETKLPISQFNLHYDYTYSTGNNSNENNSYTNQFPINWSNLQNFSLKSASFVGPYTLYPDFSCNSHSPISNGLSQLIGKSGAVTITLSLDPTGTLLECAVN